MTKEQYEQVTTSEDAISRQSVNELFDSEIKMYEERIETRKGSNYHDETERIKEFRSRIANAEHWRDKIKVLPSVKPTQNWIPVSERLPENETCVLTTIKIPNRIARVRSGWYDSGFIYNDNGDVWKVTDMEVLAWMPLPKPY